MYEHKIGRKHPTRESRDMLEEENRVVESLHSNKRNNATMEQGNWKTEKSHFLVLTGVM